MSDTSQKLVLIGLDGATFSVLRPLAEAGVIPTLARFMRQGASAVLASTCPPVTCPAWPTMFTGVNPGKHGAYSFSLRNPQTGKTRTVTSTAIGIRKIWDLIGDVGKRVCILNVPVTFPAERVNGIMLSGFVSPEQSPYVTWPRELKEQLCDKFSTLSLNWDVLRYRPSGHRKREQHIRQINELMELRCRQFEYLTNNGECDFCFLVHEFTDRVNHLFYHLLDPVCKAHRAPENQTAVKLLHEGFRKLDASLARLEGHFGSDANYIVVSDHGFDAVNSWVYVNNLLAQHGLLAFKGLKTWADVVARHLHVPDSLRPYFGLTQDEPWHRQDPFRTPLVDYTRTKAFAGPQLEHAVYVNLKGRCPGGSIESGQEYEKVKRQVLNVLSAAIDPVTGKRVFKGVWPREKIYAGPYLQNAPDVIYEPAPGFMVSNHSLPRELLGAKPTRRIKPGWDISGYHQPDGIFIGFGPAFRTSQDLHASIIDIAPTVLYLLNLPIPKYMDGVVLEEMLNADLLNSRTIQTCDTKPLSDKAGQIPCSDGHEEEMARRLAELGYL
ncbi:MAG: alkaline phosphatase family protein [Planctomycetota bacterium]|jgi:predicted AlkP superfamily phosphohydrolase/phosphomutase